MRGGGIDEQQPKKRNRLPFFWLTFGGGAWHAYFVDGAKVAGIAKRLAGGGPPKQVWDGQEYWRAYAHGQALYINWVRVAWGDRHARDLWILVDKEFFDLSAH